MDGWIGTLRQCRGASLSLASRTERLPAHHKIRCESGQITDKTFEQGPYSPSESLRVKSITPKSFFLAPPDSFALFPGNGAPDSLLNLDLHRLLGAEQLLNLLLEPALLFKSLDRAFE